MHWRTSRACATLGKLDPLSFRQREGKLATMPLAFNSVAAWRTLDTSSVARCFPFSLPDLDTRSGALYGIDLSTALPSIMRWPATAQSRER